MSYKLLGITSVIAAATAVLTNELPAQGAAPAATPSAHKLQWMQGCWQRKLGSATIEEQWTAPAGGMLMGVSRTTVVGVNRGYEFLRIFSAGDTVVYAAMPSGQRYTEFRSTSIDANSVTFENPAHDFPTKIGYRASGDSLYAFIEGPRNGKSQRIDYPYARVACPGR